MKKVTPTKRLFEVEVVETLHLLLLIFLALPLLPLLFVLCAIEGATRGALSRRLGASLD